MEILCPECRGELTSKDQQTAHCATHGGDYRILFWREPAAAAQPGINPSSQDSAPGMAAGAKCVNHPAAVAIRRCRSCSVSLCSTCAFEFPGGVVLCPNCATTAPRGLAPNRKKILLGAYGLAIWCTVAVIGLLGFGATHHRMTKDEQEAYGMVFSFVALIPSLIGTGLSVATLERRLGNPFAVWGAVIWNGVITGGMLLLCIVGALMKK